MHTNNAMTLGARSNRIRIALAALVCALGMTGAQAQAPKDASILPASEIGHSTKAWLDLQSHNHYAAESSPMMGAAASLAYQRYLDSFKAKIPVWFGSSMGSGSGSGSGLGSSGSSISQ